MKDYMGPILVCATVLIALLILCTAAVVSDYYKYAAQTAIARESCK